MGIPVNHSTCYLPPSHGLIKGDYVMLQFDAGGTHDGIPDGHIFHISSNGNPFVPNATHTYNNHSQNSGTDTPGLHVQNFQLSLTLVHLLCLIQPGTLMDQLVMYYLDGMVQIGVATGEMRSNADTVQASWLQFT